MKTRVITGIVGILLLIPVFIFSDTFVLNIAVALLSLFAVIELLKCTRISRILALLIPSLLYSVIFPVFFQSSYKYMYTFSMTYVFVMLVIGVVLSTKISTVKICTATLLTLFATNGLSSLIYLRGLSCGLYLLLLVFLGAWSTDVFGLLGGKFFGQHKLCPELSPKKTLEGAISSILACVIVFITYGIICDAFFKVDANIFNLALCGIIISVSGILGDLTASMIKRHFNIKDYSNILPGHGGIMDRFDSVIAIAPVLLLFVGRSDIFPLFIEVIL